MDVFFTFSGQRFRWDAEKALSNLAKHGIRFEQVMGRVGPEVEAGSPRLWQYLRGRLEAARDEGLFQWN